MRHTQHPILVTLVRSKRGDIKVCFTFKKCTNFVWFWLGSKQNNETANIHY